MRNPKEIRKYFQDLSDKDIENFTNEVIVGITTRHADHSMSEIEYRNLLEICKEIVGINKEEIEILRKSGEESKKEIDSMTKQNNMKISVPIETRRNIILNNISKYLFSGLKVITMLGGVGAFGYFIYSMVKINKK